MAGSVVNALVYCANPNSTTPEMVDDVYQKVTELHSSTGWELIQETVRKN